MKKFFKAFMSSLLMLGLLIAIMISLLIIAILIIQGFNLSQTSEELFEFNYGYMIDCATIVIATFLTAYIYKNKIKWDKKKVSINDLKISKVALSLLIASLYIIIVANLMDPKVNSYAKFDSGVIVMPELGVIICTLITSILWELFFRGMIFELIEDKINVIGIIFICSTLGAIAHYLNGNYKYFFTEFFNGAILTFMYYYTRNLWYPIITKVGINLMYIFNLTAYRYIYNYTLAAVAIVLLIGSLLFFHKSTQRHLNEEIDYNKIIG